MGLMRRWSGLPAPFHLIFLVLPTVVGRDMECFIHEFTFSVHVLPLFVRMDPYLAPSSPRNPLFFIYRPLPSLQIWPITERLEAALPEEPYKRGFVYRQRSSFS